jgi:hypothetical protein
MSELSKAELARYRARADEVDRNLRSKAGRARTLSKARAHLRRLGPIEFPVDVERRKGLLVARIPRLEIRVTGRSVDEVQGKLASALQELAKDDPFAILESIGERRRETVTVDFKSLAR